MQASHRGASPPILTQVGLKLLSRQFHEPWQLLHGADAACPSQSVTETLKLRLKTDEEEF